MTALAERLRAGLRGEVLVGASLADRTTLRVGGPAAALVRAEDPADLAHVAALSLPWLVLGRGSNLLVADEGWPGIVVTLGRAFRGVTVDGPEVTAGAAEPMPALARLVARHRLGGLAFGTAIPGSLGGAVRMNAGAHGRELRDVLVWAEVARLAGGGRLECWSGAELQMGYRHTALPGDAVVVRARLRLEPTEGAAVEAEMAEMRWWRRDHQPINEPSCGSVFRNPPGDSAGRLIEAAGLKGLRIGGARISPRHANFITTEPGARAADVVALIRRAQDEVAACCGVRLETEVVQVGFGEEQG